MSILAEIAVAYTDVLRVKAERAREYAAIHRAACRHRAQGLCCSTCSELNDRAARLARRAGEVG